MAKESRSFDAFSVMDRKQILQINSCFRVIFREVTVSIPPFQVQLWQLSCKTSVYPAVPELVWEQLHNSSINWSQCSSSGEVLPNKWPESFIIQSKSMFTYPSYQSIPNTENKLLFSLCIVYYMFEKHYLSDLQPSSSKKSKWKTMMYSSIVFITEMQNIPLTFPNQLAELLLNSP